LKAQPHGSTAFVARKFLLIVASKEIHDKRKRDKKNYGIFSLAEKSVLWGAEHHIPRVAIPVRNGERRLPERRVRVDRPLDPRHRAFKL
jgi:hypothetical protein